MKVLKKDRPINGQNVGIKRRIKGGLGVVGKQREDIDIPLRGECPWGALCPVFYVEYGYVKT